MRYRCRHDITEQVRLSKSSRGIRSGADRHRDSHVSVGSLYEIVGKVVNIEGGHGLGIRVLSSTEWPKNEHGQTPDIKLFEAVVDATHRYKSIFYDDGDGNGESSGY